MDNKKVEVPVELLQKIKTYIEWSEQILDGIEGESRSFKEIIADGDMPEVYKELMVVITE